MTDSTPAMPPQPRGFGGWLLVPILIVCLSPFRTLGDMIDSAESYQVVARLPNGTFFIGLNVALNVGLLTLEIIVLVVMFGRRASFPKWFTWLWLAALLLPVLELVVIVAMTNLPPWKLIDAGTTRNFVAAIVGGFWAWYLHVSVRVKNTFTN